jgi:hypothetical protein
MDSPNPKKGSKGREKNLDLSKPLPETPKIARSGIQVTSPTQMTSPIFTMDSPFMKNSFAKDPTPKHAKREVSLPFRGKPSTIDSLTPGLASLEITVPDATAVVPPKLTSPRAVLNENTFTPPTPTKQAAKLKNSLISKLNFFPALGGLHRPDERLLQRPGMQGIVKYKTWLKQRIDEGAPLDKRSRWYSAPITAAVLDDAYNCQVDIIPQIEYITGLQVVGRPYPKKLERAEEKRAREQGFKVVNDMMACRVLVPGHYKVGEYLGMVMRKLDRRLRHEGYHVLDMHAMDGTKYNGLSSDILNDIAAYIQLYAPLPIGHLMEIQVLHPFAAIQLTRSSHIERNDPFRKLGYVDLWENWFYEDVKCMLLDEPEFRGYPWEAKLGKLFKNKRGSVFYPEVDKANEELFEAVWHELFDGDEERPAGDMAA